MIRLLAGYPMATVNEPELLVRGSGYVKLDAAWNAAHVCSPYSRLYLVEAGEGILEAEGQTIRLLPGNIYLIPAGMRINYRCPESLTKIYFHISLLKSDGYDMLRGFNKVGRIPYSKRLQERMLALFGKSGGLEMMRLRQCLYEMLGDFFEKYDFGTTKMAEYSPMVRQAIRFVRENLSAQLRVGTVAENLFVSRSYLAKQFRQQVGVTIGQYIDDQLVQTAQWKLLRTSESVEKISAQLGYCDQFYFSRRFRMLCGESPLQFRKKLQAADHWN